MLATFFLSKSTKTQIILPFQRLNITFNVIRTNLSSSSSDSSSSDSDSDLDTEISNEIKDKLRGIDYLQSAKAARKRRQIEREITKAAQILTTSSDQDKGKILSVLLDTISNIQTVDNTLSKSKEDEAKELKKIHKLQSQQKKVRHVSDRFERKYETQKEPSIIEMLKSQSSMRKDIDDKLEMKYERRMEPSIIHKLQSQQEEVRDVSDKFERKYETQKEPSIIEMLKSQSSMRKDIDDKLKMKYERRMEPSVIHKLQSQQKEVRDVSDKFERKYETQKEPSIIEMLKSQSSMRKDIDDKFEMKYERRMEPSVIHKLQSQQKGSSIIHDNERGNTDYERIFDDFPENTNVPKLKMWDTWEREQLQFLTSKYPTNAFQEMIQWSKEGKLWKFPIDNEQGMEKEQNVHFSKHVFLERELIPWCPPKGPIRHFMELVCVGLSKNPYMTIEEKYNHIMWYKNYFNDKHDLLEKLGVLG